MIRLLTEEITGSDLRWIKPNDTGWDWNEAAGEIRWGRDFGVKNKYLRLYLTSKISKRTSKERLDLITTASEDVLKDLNQ